MLLRIIKSAWFYKKQWQKSVITSLRRSWVKFHVFCYERSAGLVFIGPYFASLGGVSNHIQCLSAFSKTRTSTLPSQELLKFLLKYQLLPYYKSVVAQKSFSHPLVHSHVDPWFIGVCEKAQQRGAQWVHTYHTLYFEKDWDKGLEPWQEEINDALINRAIHADIKISIAHWLKNYLKTHHNIDTIYLPNGVDVKKCDASLGTRFTSKYGLKDFILFASGISDIKNAGDFLKLSQSLPDKTFVIIGRGITEEKLKHKFKIDLGTNIHVFGAMPHDQLLDAIAACKVFVVTSRSEGLPTVLMEAMALERSVVGVNTYGTKEVIHSDKFGYLYAHDNFDDLVAKTKLAFDVSKGVKARERILEHYDWKVIAPQIDDLYKTLLNEKT